MLFQVRDCEPLGKIRDRVPDIGIIFRKVGFIVCHSCALLAFPFTARCFCSFFFCSGFSFGWLFALLLFYFAFLGLFGRETERRGMFDVLQDVYAG